jgi:hypothetical protein
MRAVEGPVSFYVWEPNNVPGFDSNIAKVFGCSENQTDNLLKAVEVVKSDHHYRVERRPIKKATPGSKGKKYPRKIQVTISPA